MFKNIDVTSLGQYILYAVITIGGGYMVATGHLTAAELAFMMAGLGTGHGVATSVATKSSTKALYAVRLAGAQEAVQHSTPVRANSGEMPTG